MSGLAISVAPYSLSAQSLRELKQSPSDVKGLLSTELTIEPTEFTSVLNSRPLLMGVGSFTWVESRRGAA